MQKRIFYGSYILYLVQCISNKDFKNNKNKNKTIGFVYYLFSL